MRSQIFRGLLVAVLSIGLGGCGEKQTHSKVSAKDSQIWKLANGTEFSVTVNSADDPSERSWIWCDLDKGPVSYRIVDKGQSGEWKPMAKVLVSNDEKLMIRPDPTGMFGDAIIVPRGTYSVEFKVGDQKFSAARLQVD